MLPAGQSSVADWYAIAMARCGISEDYETYLAALKTYVESAYAENGGLSANKATEWHRVALAVTALGGDAAAFGTKPDGTTIDLIADGCYDCVVEGGPGAQGLNGWIFALLALGLRVVFAYALHKTSLFGYTAIWWSQAMSWTITLVVCYVHFFRGKWKEKSLVS